MRQQVSADKEKELGARLRGYRNYRGMSQSDLGKHLDTRKNLAWRVIS